MPVRRKNAPPYPNPRLARLFSQIREGKQHARALSDAMTARCGLKELRCILGAGCLNAWLWLTFRGYGDMEPLLFNDEFGRLFAVLPCSAAALLLLGLYRDSLRRAGLLARLWSAGSVCLMVPALLGLNIPLFSGALSGTLLSLPAGFGFAVGFMVLGLSVAGLSRPGILIVVGGGIFMSRALIHGLLTLRPDSLFLLPVVFALAAKVLLEAPASLDAEANVVAAKPDRMFAAGGLWPVYAVYALTGLSHGLYYSLLAVMEPLLPRPKPHLLFIVALSCLISPLCIHLARRASIWRTILLMGPLLVVGYTAWPLLHRESPALSLDSLHFAYTLLGVYSYATLFFAAARLNQNGEGGGIRLIGFGGATLLFSLLLGTYALPGIRSSLSQGTTVNYLFAFLAVTILISSFAFVFLLERLGFWASPRNDRESRPALLPPENAPPVMHALACENPAKQEDEDGMAPETLSLEQCERIFRTLGLTRQQALIAAMLAQKRQDAEICGSLSISQSTLKTHIRNILRRLSINSRHELPWLVCQAAGSGQNRA